MVYGWVLETCSLFEGLHEVGVRTLMRKKVFAIEWWVVMIWGCMVLQSTFLRSFASGWDSGGVLESFSFLNALRTLRAIRADQALDWTGTVKRCGTAEPHHLLLHCFIPSLPLSLLEFTEGNGTAGRSRRASFTRCCERIASPSRGSLRKPVACSAESLMRCFFGQAGLWRLSFCG